MPSFGAALSAPDRTLLARLVLGFDSQHRAPGTALPAIAAPSVATQEMLARGAAVFERLQCAGCHGASLHGDGPLAATQRPAPYDLTREAPRGGGDLAAIVRAIRTGLDGTTMPGFDGGVSNDDLVALAGWVASQIPDAVRARRAANDPGESAWLGDAPLPGLVPAPVGLSDDARVARERDYWRFPLALQGEGPAHLGPAEHSLQPDRCGRCHARQFEQFRGTIHARAMGPGVMGQLLDANANDVSTCQTCHAPLAEQLPANRASAAFDPELREGGVVCASCHLRGRERFGPPSRALAPGPGSPSRLPGMFYPLTRLARFERGDFCVACHQHTSRDSIAGRPVLNTVIEWVESPYFARGVQCQHCHMPDRDHTWRGAHDPDTVRQALHVYGSVTRDGDGLAARVGIENVGAGHSFPGTTTPAAVMELQWLDASGRPVGAAVRDVIQRHLEWDGHAWSETFDTRILAGAARILSVRTADRAAQSLRYTLTFRPDDYYEGLYRRAVGEPSRSAPARAMLRQALDRASHSPFVVRTGVIEISAPGPTPGR